MSKKPLLTPIALASLSLIAIGASLASYFAGGSVELWLSNGSWTVAALVALLGTTAAFRKSPPEHRSAWRLLVFASVAWLLGQCFWDYQAATEFLNSPNAADGLWLAFAGLAAFGVHRFGGAIPGRHISWLEVTPLVVAVSALLTAALWDEIQRSSLGVAAEVTALAYPAVYVTAAVVMLQAIFAGRLSVTADRGTSLMFAGLLIEAVAFILWTPQLLAVSYVSGASPLDALWVLGMVFFGVGAYLAQPSTAAVPDHVRDRRGGVLPSITFFTLAGYQVVYTATTNTSFANVALSIGVLFVGGSLAARGAILRQAQASIRAQLGRNQEKLREANERLELELRRDPLTGLGNRVRLNEDLESLAARVRRHDQAYAIAIFDIDRFKAYNDTFGHQAGDMALSRIGALLTEHGRSEDQLYRYGGEELLLVLTDPNFESATTVAERLRVAVEGAVVRHPLNEPFGVLTISGGVAVAQPGENPDNVIARADTALYEAKESGRNRVIEAGWAPVPRAGSARAPVPTR